MGPRSISHSKPETFRRKNVAISPTRYQNRTRSLQGSQARPWNMKRKEKERKKRKKTSEKISNFLFFYILILETAFDPIFALFLLNGPWLIDEMTWCRDAHTVQLPGVVFVRWCLGFRDRYNTRKHIGGASLFESSHQRDDILRKWKCQLRFATSDIYEASHIKEYDGEAILDWRCWTSAWLLVSLTR